MLSAPDGLHRRGTDGRRGQLPRRSRAKRGEREAQFVAYVKENPGSKLADIARGIGVQNSAANGLAKKTVASGQVKKAADKTYSAA